MKTGEQGRKKKIKDKGTEKTGEGGKKENRKRC